MNKIRITGVPPYDGDYDADLDSFTNRELRTIKRVSGGITGARLQQALLDGDQDAFLGLVYVALERSGRFPAIVEDILLDAAVDAIEFIVDDDAADETDDASAEGNSPSAPAPEAAAESSSSGASSSERSALPEPTLLRTGTQG